MTDARTQAAIETVIRLESARLIAGLAHYTGDIGLAEDLAQDAVVAALEQWPGDGVPRNPGAWLMTVAKRRAIDLFRRNAELEKKYAQIGRALAAEGGDNGTPDFDRAFSDDIDDDLLRLIFTACHPVLSGPGQGRADAPAARRPDHGRDRARLPGAGADDRAAHRAREEDAGRGERAVRGAGRRPAARPGCPRCSRSST